MSPHEKQKSAERRRRAAYGSVGSPGRSGRRGLPKERAKTALALVLALLAAGMNQLILSFVHEHVPDGPPLPDVFFAHFAARPAAILLSECLMLGLMVAMLLLLAVHEHRWILLRRISTIGALLYGGRGFTMLFTQLPRSDPASFCSPKLELGERTFSRMLARGLRMLQAGGLVLNGDEQFVLCGDFIYSGHTIVLVACCLFIWEYGPSDWRLLHAAAWMAAAVGLFGLLEDHEHNHLRKVFWHPIFHFMEANVRRHVPHEYSLPFGLGHQPQDLALYTSNK
ncbi:hypothetical protein M3Y99_00738100 [Aphelenchoides fujianensis]|nr:hypothetical protein M3Y99_00738100 [Aphelenchoides fujianensis]